MMYHQQNGLPFCCALLNVTHLQWIIYNIQQKASYLHSILNIIVYIIRVQQKNVYQIVISQVLPCKRTSPKYIFLYKDQNKKTALSAFIQIFSYFKD